MMHSMNEEKTNNKIKTGGGDIPFDMAWQVSFNTFGLQQLFQQQLDDLPQHVGLTISFIIEHLHEPHFELQYGRMNDEVRIIR